MPCVKAQTDRYSQQALLCEEINGILCCTETKALSTFRFLTSNKKITSEINMSNRMPVSLLLTRAISGDSWAAFAAFSFRNTGPWKTQGLKCNPRTEMRRLWSSHQVGGASAGASAMTRALSSLGEEEAFLLGARPLEAPPCARMSDDNLASWELVAHLHIRCLYLPQALVQVIIWRLDFKIQKKPQMSMKFLFWTFLKHSEPYKMILLF